MTKLQASPGSSDSKRVTDERLAEHVGYFDWLCDTSKHPMHHDVKALLHELQHSRLQSTQGAAQQITQEQSDALKAAVEALESDNGRDELVEDLRHAAVLRELQQLREEKAHV